MRGFSVSPIGGGFMVDLVSPLKESGPPVPANAEVVVMKDEGGWFGVHILVDGELWDDESYDDSYRKRPDAEREAKALAAHLRIKYGGYITD